MSRSESRAFAAAISCAILLTQAQVGRDSGESEQTSELDQYTCARILHIISTFLIFGWIVSFAKICELSGHDLLFFANFVEIWQFMTAFITHPNMSRL